jgi:hypothetical protein
MFVFSLFIINVIVYIWIELLEKAKTQINVLKEKYRQLADILGRCPGQYYRYHSDLRSEAQTVVSVLILLCTSLKLENYSNTKKPRKNLG